MCRVPRHQSAHRLARNRTTRDHTYPAAVRPRRRLVSRSSYPLFALEVNLLAGSMLLNLVGRAVGTLPLERAARMLLLPLVPAALLHLTIYAYAWPRLLVPPDLRDQPGAVARARERRRRLAKGLAPTSHQVVIYDMRPSADLPDPFPPQFAAGCQDEDCGWTSEPLYQDEPGAEAQVRREARDHSDQVAAGTRVVFG